VCIAAVFGGLPKGGGGRLPSYSLPPNQNLKITDFIDMMTPNVLHGLPFSRNQLQKLANDEYIRILKIKLKTWDALDEI
jgi:hypothetical protein